MAALSRAQRDEYHERGFLNVAAALPPALLDSLTAALAAEVERRARTLYAAGEITDLCAADPFTTRWYHLWRQRGGEQERFGWHGCVFSRAIYDLWLEPAILDAIESLLGPDLQINGDYWVRPKLPDEELTTLPWHQDSAYMPDTAQYHWPAVWLPLVDVTVENGAMQFLPGTHRLPIQPHEQAPGVAFATPSVDPAQGREVVTLEMQRGDFVIFHNHVFHRSTPNREPMVRWSVDLRFSPAGTPMGDMWHRDMRFVVRTAGNRRAAPPWEQVQAMWQTAAQRISQP